MIFTLVIGLALAFVLGMVAQQLKLSPLVGYLVAGMLAAQPWWGHPVDQHVVEEFSHIGVVLLLFGVGLHFHFKDLLAVRKVAVPGAVSCSLIWTGIGGLVYYLCGGAGGWVAAAIFGMCVCVSSTVVLTRVLEDNKMLQTPAGHTALGWLVVEDLFTIILLVLMPVMFGNDALLPALGGMALKLTLLVLIVVLLGKRVITKVLTYVARKGSDELFTLGVLVIALGIAVLSSYVFNASMEFGAFLSGMVVGQSKFASRAASDALPMRDAFAVLFFVSVGMGFQMGGLVEYWPLALGTTAYVLLIKPVTGYVVIRLLRRPARLGVVVGGALAQIGEFSFILATLAASTYGVLPLYAANVITGAAIISITLNAALFRYVPKLIHVLEQHAPVPEDAGRHVPEASESRHRVIVVGYGPSGEIMTDLLLKYDVEPVVLEMNIDTVTRLSQLGIPALHGDARLRHILKLAGAEHAQAIMITAAAAPSKAIASAARSLNPKIEVMAYTTYMRQAQELRTDGSKVFSGEEEVALSMFTTILRNLGATEEQIGRERMSTRRKLAGLPPVELLED